MFRGVSSLHRFPTGNSQEDCYPKKKIPTVLQIVESGSTDYKEFSWVLMALVLGLCIVLWAASYFIDKYKNRHSVPQGAANASEARRERSRDKKYALDRIGEGTVYRFLLTSSYLGWIITLLTIFVQFFILVPFIMAADFDLLNDKSDVAYTWKCSRDNIVCEDKGDLNGLGWWIFAILMAAFLLGDIINGAMLIVFSAKAKHSFRRMVKYFASGVFLFSITLYVFYVSTIYNKVIAESNTAMIINSVAILFTMDVDEKLYMLIKDIGFVKDILTTEDEDMESNDDAQGTNMDDEANEDESRELIRTLREELEDTRRQDLGDRQQGLGDLESRMERMMENRIEDLRDMMIRPLAGSAHTSSDVV